MVQHNEEQKVKLTAEDYVSAFKTGILPNGDKLSPVADKTIEAQRAAIKYNLKNNPLAVSDKVKYFILNFINNSDNEMARTVDLGKAALHSDIVTNPLGDDQIAAASKYTAWAGVPCKRMLNLGLVEQLKVKNVDPAINRKNIVYYKITQAGKLWLNEYNTTQ